MLIISDSRLKLISPYIDYIIQHEKLPYKIEVEAVKGANLEIIEETGARLLKENQYHLVLVCGGVNDLTVLNHATGRVSPVFDDLGCLVDTLTDKLHSLKETLGSYTQYLIIGQITGLHMNTYNKDKSDHDILQRIIGGGMRYVNRVVCSINEENQVIPPWWFSDIHTYDKMSRRYLDKYVKFHDGLHPDNILLMRWAEAIVASMSKNIQNCYQ